LTGHSIENQERTEKSPVRERCCFATEMHEVVHLRLKSFKDKEQEASKLLGIGGVEDLNQSFEKG